MAFVKRNVLIFQLQTYSRLEVAILGSVSWLLAVDFAVCFKYNILTQTPVTRDDASVVATRQLGYFAGKTHF